MIVIFYFFVNCFVVNLRTVSPLNIDNLKECFNSKHIFTLEDNYIAGGIGSAIASVAAEKGLLCTRLGFPNEFVRHGKQKELFDIYSLTPEKIADEIERILK